MVLSLLALYAAMRTLLAVFFEGYKAVGKPWLVPAYNGCKLAVLVPSMIVGAQHGIIGLAVAYLPVSAIEIPAALGVSRAVLGISPARVWRALRVPLGAALASAAVTVAVEAGTIRLTGGSDVAALLLAFLAGAGAYLAGIYVLDPDLLAEVRIVLLSGL
jgi:hypothetical protein